MSYRPPPLREVLAAAFIEGLERKARESAREPLAAPVPLDGTGRAPVVRLRRARGDA